MNRFRVSLMFDEAISYDPLVVDQHIKTVEIDAASAKEAEVAATKQEGGFSLDYLTEIVAATNTVIAPPSASIAKEN